MIELVTGIVGEAAIDAEFDVGVIGSAIIAACGQARRGCCV